MSSVAGTQAAFGALVREYRQAAMLSQEALAERAGLSVDAISLIERGRRVNPRLDTVALLAKALELDSDDRAALVAAARASRPPAVASQAPAPARTSAAAATTRALPPLPASLTRFIGREREVAAVSDRLLVPAARLVTLTGVGGTGKTRLGLQVAREVEGAFHDGVVFVDLAPLADPALVLPAIARTLRIEDRGEGLVEALCGALRDKQMLLVLDNFEQVLEAAPLVVELLVRCSEVRVLATSRAALQVRGERLFVVPPLMLPVLLPPPTLEQLRQNEAVRLFVERAQDVELDFALTPENATIVAEICTRVEGLPLAVELAAARISRFAPEILLQRLSNRLALLTDGFRDLSTRQRTLRSTIDWSYNLLSNAEQRLFARLSVFVGGCTLEAAEAVCNSEGDLDLLATLASLVDKGLVRGLVDAGGEPRFGMLETIRDYANERLAERGELEQAHALHTAYFLAFAEEAAAKLRGEQSMLWLDRLEAEMDNMRSIRDRSLASPRPDDAMRLAEALWTLWMTRCGATESRSWLEAVVAHPGEADPGLRAGSLVRLVASGILPPPPEEANRRLAEASSLYERIGDQSGIAFCRIIQGHTAMHEGDLDLAWQRYAASLALYRELGKENRVAAALHNMARVAYLRRDYPRAADLLDEALVLEHSSGNLLDTSKTLLMRSDVAIEQGDLTRAMELARKAHSIAIKLESPHMTNGTLGQMAAAALALGDVPAAEALLQDILRLPTYDGSAEYAYLPLAELANAAALQGRFRRAVRLWAASSAGVEADPPEMHYFYVRRDHCMAAARSHLTDAAWRDAWQEGQAMSVAQAVAYALGENEDPEDSPTARLSSRQIHSTLPLE